MSGRLEGGCKKTGIRGGRVPVLKSFLGGLSVLYLLNDCLESGGVVEGEVGEDLAVDFDTALVDETHELGVREVFHTCGSVDTLNPKSTEVALLVLAVAVSVGKTFFPGVLSYGPHIAAASEVTAGEF